MQTQLQAPQNRTFTNDYWRDVYKSQQYPTTDYEIRQVMGPQYFLKETPKKKAYEYIADYFAIDRKTKVTHYLASRKLKTYHHKYLCVGGRLDGTMDTEQEAKDYRFFRGRDKVTGKPITILLWDGML